MFLRLHGRRLRATLNSEKPKFLRVPPWQAGFSICGTILPSCRTFCQMEDYSMTPPEEDTGKSEQDPNQEQRPDE
jgi:hypothetical protein